MAWLKSNWLVLACTALIVTTQIGSAWWADDRARSYMPFGIDRELLRLVADVSVIHERVEEIDRRLMTPGERLRYDQLHPIQPDGN